MGVTRWGNKKSKDFALSNQRGIVTNCEVITKADIGSENDIKDKQKVSEAEDH